MRTAEEIKLELDFIKREMNNPNNKCDIDVQLYAIKELNRLLLYKVSMEINIINKELSNILTAAKLANL